MRIKELYAETGSIGQLYGTIESASYAFTAAYAENGGMTDFTTGSYTGSFIGELVGTASYAETASVVLGTIESASHANYAATAAYAENGGGSGGDGSIDDFFNWGQYQYNSPGLPTQSGAVLTIITASSGQTEATASRTLWSNYGDNNDNNWNNSIDGNMGNRWTEGSPAGKHYGVDFGENIVWYKFIMDVTNNSSDYVKIFAVSSSNDGSVWDTHGLHSGSVVTIWSGSSPITSRYLRVGCVQPPGGWWSINEFNVILAESLTPATLDWKRADKLPASPYVLFEADAGINVGDGDPVDTWEDQSGNARDVSQTGSARPTYRADGADGLPLVEFDGSDDNFLFAFDSAYNSDDFTYAAVLRQWTTGSNWGPTSFNKIGANDWNNGGTFAFTSYSSYQWNVEGGGGRSISSGPILKWLWMPVVIRFSTGMSSYFYTVQIGDHLRTNTYSRTDALTFTHGTIGARMASGITPSNFARCDFRMWAVWDRAITDGELTAAIAYMRAKWGTL